METKTIILPKEFNAKKYVVRAFCPRNIKNLLMNAAQEKNTLKSQEILLTKCVINPPITQAFLDSDDCDGAEMDYLSIYLMGLYHLDTSEERIEELKKKTQIE